ncbi:phosphatase PAP2 family protein [Brachybacterium kimchii]|uniref:Phosphatase PAP2 family protein n=1 Tax=Brachybacterium kimchii TaxID=2942909 RepID=A0ABY4N4N9_9MICO|nr:phosphatase PAP2 family protein [Brachybacterium kimchii]UQN29086.1 phosphatase PAP2 family protein [Brachybacterium kimchii]
MTRMRRWPYTFAVALSLLIGAAAVVSSLYLGLPLRDPDGFLGPSYIRLPLLALGFIGGGLILEAARRSGVRRLPAAIVDVAKKEWNVHRLLCIGTGLLSFYVCYVAYRNLKSMLPVYRRGTLFDRQLLHIDSSLTEGHNPAVMLHHLLGTDIAANFLSVAYLAYLPLVPISLGAFLVLSRTPSTGAWYATTLCLNWVLGTVSYYILPSVGPAFSDPGAYRTLPDTGVSQLQDSLFATRLDYLSDPVGSDSIQGVAAFASLHVSVTFAAALFMRRTNQKAPLRVTAWIFFGVTTVATIYFGWHYILDDISGMAIGWASVTLAAWATGQHRARQRPVGLPTDADLGTSALAPGGSRPGLGTMHPRLSEEQLRHRPARRRPSDRPDTTRPSRRPTSVHLERPAPEPSLHNCRGRIIGA